MHGAAQALLGCGILSPQGTPQSTGLQGQEPPAACLSLQMSLTSPDCAPAVNRTAPAERVCPCPGLSASKPQRGGGGGGGPTAGTDSALQRA